MASTRKGTPCQREPLPGRDYCPSHKHLEEAFEPSKSSAPPLSVSADGRVAARGRDGPVRPGLDPM